MANTETVNINTGDEAAKGPSIEDQYNDLVKEGLIAPDGDNPTDEDNPEVAQGGAEGDETGSTEQRPSWLPEKFKTPEDMAKAYEELEKGNSQKSDDDDGEESQTSTEPTAEERAAAEEATNKAGLDLNAVSQEWFDNDGLSEETYTKLSEAGYPKEMVDVYIEGLTSRTNSVVNEVYSTVGGEEAYGEMLDWAATNMSVADQKEFDKAVNSNDRFKVMNAVKGLRADFQASKADASDEPEETVSSKSTAPQNVYDSMDEYMEDLDDPRYDTNETFRRKVMEKLARSSI